MGIISCIHLDVFTKWKSLGHKVAPLTQFLPSQFQNPFILLGGFPTSHHHNIALLPFDYFSARHMKDVPFPCGIFLFV
jgi:hypothetical protein